MSVRTTQLVMAIVLLAADLQLPRPSRWERVVPDGLGAWQETWTPGRIPLAIVPVTGPGRQLFMVGGLGVWASRDGIQWQRATGRPPWRNRFGATTVYFRGELWSMGGEEDRVKQNDIWRSSDGASWTRAAAHAPWSARRWHAAAVFRERLWVLGGTDTEERSDVWRSADGVSWQLVAGQAPWSPRGGHAAVVWRDRLCIIGGGSFSKPRMDVWCSADGRQWSELTPRAEWSPRVYPGVAVFDDRLWVFGGSATGVDGDAAWLNDVWVSADGARWIREPNAPWSPRAPIYSTTFRGRLWVFGGKGIEANGKGGFADDVWTMF